MGDIMLECAVHKAFIVDQTVGPYRIDIGIVSKVHFIGDSAAGGAHVDFEPDDISFFAQARFVLVEPEKFKMEKQISCRILF